MSFLITTDGLQEINKEADYYLDDETLNRMLTDSDFFEKVKEALKTDKVIERLGELNAEGKYEEAYVELDVAGMREKSSLGYFKKVGE